MSIILKAAQMANFWHQDQRRKNNGRPYITHLIRVAGRVCLRPDSTEEMVAAAYLHDAIEDQAKDDDAYNLMKKRIEGDCNACFQMGDGPHARHELAASSCRA